MSLDPNLILLAIAFFNALTALVGWYTHKAAKATQADVLKIEKATNSMKDALVAATAQASEAKGRDEERAKGEDKAEKLLTMPTPLPVADAAAVEGLDKVVEAIQDAAKDKP